MAVSSKKTAGQILPTFFSSSKNHGASEISCWEDTHNSSQPATTGFSTFKNATTGGPDNIIEAAGDFNAFMSAFLVDMFPQYARVPLHIAGESFGGKYVPEFVQYISQRQMLGSDGVVPVPIQSIILVDPVVDAITAGVLGHYDHFCGEGVEAHPHGFNDTACRALEAATPQCERLVAVCGDTYDRNVCETATTFCEENLGKWLSRDVFPGGRDPYDDRKKCGDNPPVCEAFNGTGYSTYMDLPRVKEALGFSSNFSFQGINFELNSRWTKSKDVFVPSKRALTFILDQTPIRVLILNGNNDVIVYESPIHP
jgi:cathepsin A (carboxypeptidase C)